MDSCCYDITMSSAIMPSAISRHANNINDINYFLTTSGSNTTNNGANSGNSTNAVGHIQQQPESISNSSNCNRHLIAARVESPTDSDIDVDDLNVKEEPLSPDSSCPSTPNSPQQHYDINLNLASMAAYTHTDLVLEHHKVR